MLYLGDFPEDATVYIPFNTFTSNDPAASSTITNLVEGDVHVHKDGGTTQVVSPGVTVSINFDGITGNHLITLDTSEHTDYATGSEYAVRIEGGTVDSGNINAWIGCFSIERAGGVLALMKATTLASIATAIDNVSNGVAAVKAETVLILADTADIQPNYATEAKQDTAQTDLNTITGTSGVLIGTDAANVTEISDAVWDEPFAGHSIAGSFGQAIEDIDADVELILQDTADIQPNYATATGVNALSNSVAAVKAETVLILADTAAMQPEVAKMVFTNANELDVNTKSINDAEVIGDGNATPWDGV